MSSRRWSGPGDDLALKILVTGGYGAGKTSFVGSVSEIRPLRTEEAESGPGGESHDGADAARAHESGPVDAPPPGAPDGGRTTTVALDFGRITMRPGLSLYLFGTPGQSRFRHLRAELVAGALGAVVVVDTHRLADCFPAVDHLEQHGIPFAVAVNRFDGAAPTAGHGPEQVARALNLPPGIPVLPCDARERESVRHVLAALVEYAGRFQTARLLDTALS